MCRFDRSPRAADDPAIAPGGRSDIHLLMIAIQSGNKLNAGFTRGAVQQTRNAIEKTAGPAFLTTVEITRDISNSVSYLPG